MKKINIEKGTDTEDTFNLIINEFVLMSFSMDELKDLSSKLHEFIEKNTHINYSFIRNKKTGRLEKVFDND